jgi:two-component system sensor kinase FixL
VLDSGAGVRTEEVDRLFQLYYRSPETAAKAGGAGIGLFVCRALVEAMGGRIWAAPRPEGGSEFGFILERYAEDDVPSSEAT